MSVENAIETALVRRAQNSGQLNGLEAEQLAGFGKSLKKFAKKLGKTIKKIAPYALGAAGLYVGGRLIGGALAKRAAARKIAGKGAAAVLAAGASTAPPAADVQQAAQRGPGLAEAATAITTAYLASRGAGAAVSDPEVQAAIQQQLQQQAESGDPYAGKIPASGGSAAGSGGAGESAAAGSSKWPSWAPLAALAGVGILLAMNSKGRVK